MKDVMTMIKNVGEFEFLKAFPMMILYKNDIEFTPEIIDHYIKFYNAEPTYMEKIPVEKMTTQQKRSYIRMCLYNNVSTYDIVNFKNMIKGDFEIQYQLYKATSVFTFKILTEKQKKILADLTFKRMNYQNFTRRMSKINTHVFNRVLDYYENRFVKLKQAKSFIIYIANNNELSDIERFYSILDKLLDQYPILIEDLASYSHRPNVSEYLFKHLPKSKGEEYLTDRVIEQWNITEKSFKSIRNTYLNQNDGIYVLRQILIDNEILTTTKYGNRKTIYLNGFVHYNIKKIYKMLTDASLMTAYINSKTYMENYK